MAFCVVFDVLGEHVCGNILDPMAGKEWTLNCCAVKERRATPRGPVEPAFPVQLATPTVTRRSALVPDFGVPKLSEQLFVEVFKVFLWLMCLSHTSFRHSRFFPRQFSFMFSWWTTANLEKHAQTFVTKYYHCREKLQHFCILLFFVANKTVDFCLIIN